MKNNLKSVYAIALATLLSMGCKKEYETSPKMKVKLATTVHNKYEIVKEREKRGIAPSKARTMIFFNNSEKVKDAFRKFARDFGIKGDCSDQAKNQFEDFLAGHVISFRNEPIEGNYRGLLVTHYYDSRYGTRLNVITDRTTKELLDVRRLTELEYHNLRRRKSLN